MFDACGGEREEATEEAGPDTERGVVLGGERTLELVLDWRWRVTFMSMDGTGTGAGAGAGTGMEAAAMSCSGASV